MRSRASAGFRVFASIACLAILAGCSPEGGGGDAATPPAETPPAPDAGASAPDAVAKGGAEGDVCGGIRGLACAESLWCDPDPGNCSGADIQGICVATPEMCTRDYRPVCGCDGRTHGNECSRRAARVAKDHDGECAPAAG